METLSDDLSEMVLRLGIDPGLPQQSLRRELGEAIAARGGDISWEQDEAGWSVMLYSPIRAVFFGYTLERALAWCLSFLEGPEYGISDDIR